MEEKSELEEFKKHFCETANGLAQAFNQTVALATSAQTIGYKEAYEEILNWAVAQQDNPNGDIPLGKIISILQERLNFYKSSEGGVSEGVSSAATMSDVGMAENQEVESKRKIYRCRANK